MNEQKAMYELQPLPDELIIAVVSGEMDIQRMMYRELCYRGINSEGKWIGLKAAEADYLEKYPE